MSPTKRRKIDRKIYYSITAVALVCMAAGAGLSLWTVGGLRTALQMEFNEQQAVIASGVSAAIERKLGFIRKELAFGRSAIAGNTADPDRLDQSVGNMFIRLIDYGVRKIEVVAPERKTVLVYMPYRARNTRELDAGYRDLPSLAQLPDGAMACLYPNQAGASAGCLKLAIGLPGPDWKLLVCEVNLNWFLTPLLKGIRSGKTGYAWIIDEAGIFVYHPDAGFIRQSAFTARQGKNPHFSFKKIDHIQKKKMLKGEAGTGLYETTWHRGITGRVEKLIAYCPVTISCNPPRRWSVAVVAPVEEVADEVKKATGRQFGLQGLVIVVIVLGAAAILFMEQRWSHRLEKTVEKRTAAYRRSEEKYRSLVESAEDFIYSVDRSGRFLSMNNFTAKFFGGSAKEFIGRGITDLFEADVARRQLELINLVFRFGKSVRDELEIKTGDHTTWISANFMPLKDRQGDLSAILCIARDITENKELEYQLIHTEKLASIGTLAAGVAHEVNNPLGVMLGFCDLILQKTDESTQTYQDLKVIERQGLHCKRVVENLLSFSRQENQSSESTDVNACIGEVLSVVGHTLNMHHIELKTELAENLPPGQGDYRQLQQVFMNLVNNAVAAMADEGELRISTGLESNGKKVAIRFSDNGAGISAGDMEHIFEPFFTTKPDGEGTGLGLFVSYGIVTRYGGTLECKSRPARKDRPIREPGRTTFTVRLRVN